MPGAAPAGPVTFSAPEGKSKLPGIMIAAFAAFGGFLYGFDTGYISGVKAMPHFLEVFVGPGTTKLPAHDDSLITSILSAGTFFGALAAYPVGDNLGRRLGLVFACAVFCIGIALQTAASTIPTFTVGRVFAGLGVGMVSCLVPMYQSETSPKWIRGAVVACYQWAITIGLLIAAIVVNGTKNLPDARAYRIPIGLQFIWAAILAGGVLCLPESPRYLILKGKDDKALRSLGRLLSASPDSDEVQAEYVDIKANLEAERELNATSYMDCFRNNEGKNGLRTWTGIALQGLQQLTGINFIFYYGTTFFQSAGISNSFLITIATNVVNVGMTVPGILAVDKLGRRSLLLWGAIIMCFCELLVAIIGATVSVTDHAGQQVLIAFTCIYIGAFAATWGPIAWVVIGEIFPLAIRAKSMSMATASNWLWNFGIGYATPYMVDTGPGNAGLQSNVFFIWGGCCFLCIAFTYFFIPETHGLSLEQVDMMYTHSSILGSGAYRRALLEQGQNHPDIQAARQKEVGAHGDVHRVESKGDKEVEDV